MAKTPRTYGGFRMRMPGWVVLISLILVLLAAWNTGANLLYIVAGGLGGFVAITIVLTGRMVRRLTVTREGPTAIHRTEKFGVSVRVENRKLLTPAISLRVERAVDSGRSAGYILRIPARRAAVVRMTESFARRGVQPLPEIAVVSGFPFGLYERRLRVRDACEVVVYPRVSTVRSGMLEQLPGACPVPRVVRGEGSEFFSLREYVPGDDLRHMAWRASAHRGTLLVKEMARETTRHIVFVIDTYDRPDIDGFDDRFEEAIELVASLAATLLNLQYTVSIVTPETRLSGGEGQSQSRKVLETLARVMPSTARPVEGFAWFAPGDEAGFASYAFVSPDPAMWGQRVRAGGSRVLDPREAVRA